LWHRAQPAIGQAYAPKHDTGDSKAVDSVHQATMSGDYVAAVLDGKAAFDRTLGQIPQLPGNRDHDRHQTSARERCRRIQHTAGEEPRGDAAQRARAQAAGRSRPCLGWRYFRGQFGAPDDSTDEIGADIGHPYDGNEKDPGPDPYARAAPDGEEGDGGKPEK